MQKILVTGSAGFIGFHLINKLIKYDFQILGIDSLNDYYSIKLKLDRLSQLGIFPEKIDKNNLINSSFHKDLTFACIDISDAKMINRLFEEHKFNVVINLAAQAGVRYSMINPKAYLSSNINGFFNILEACKEFPVSHLIYASTSSVYGLNTNFPLKENESTDNPVSLYAATKKTNELMAHAYSNLFGIPTTGLRFFTVYGPWGRPDMSPFLFTNAIFNGHPINVFNNGNMMRDFTFIDDIVESIYRLIELPPKESLSVYVNNENSVSNNKIFVPYRILNIGNGNPVPLEEFINYIEIFSGKKAKKNYLEMQRGDVKDTHSDCSLIENLIRFKPNTPIEVGVEKYVNWFKEYYSK